MKPLLKAFTPQTYALMRIVIGFLFLCHGLDKIFGTFGKPGLMALIDQGKWLIVAAGFIELLGGLCIMFGLLTSPVAFLCSGTMAVAYFMAHQPQGALPIQNGGELAAAYAWLFLFMAAKGGGIWSLDALLFGGGKAEG